VNHRHISQIKRAFSLYLIFCKIGAFTIGGGYAMLPIIEHEFVAKKKWVSEQEMVDIIAIVQSLPGVIAFNTSMFIGYRYAGMLGSVMAALGMLTPSLIIITIFAYLYVSVQDNRYVQSAFRGIRSGVSALIALAGWKLARRVVNNPFTSLIAVASFTAVWFLNVHAALVIVIAAAGGLIVTGVRRARNASS
jgi:chromate transporter